MNDAPAGKYTTHSGTVYDIAPNPEGAGVIIKRRGTANSGLGSWSPTMTGFAYLRVNPDGGFEFLNLVTDDDGVIFTSPIREYEK